MIFYFSGTGNSRYVAANISEAQGEGLISISKELSLNKDKYEYELQNDEKIIFVYPIYAWAPPAMVVEFIKKMNFINYKGNYISTVAVCGENIGNTIKVVNKVLGEKGMKLSSGFSVVTPNNYIIMGDVDSKEGEKKKLENLELELAEINKAIMSEEKDKFNIVKGPLPGVLTTIANPLFNKFAIDLKNFRVNDNCTGCGICEKVCNGTCIKVNEKPSWSGRCTQCLACIHYCPVKAIQYGKNSEKKGRYTNPNVKITEMFIK
ncbi:MAG: EFR1 family ferrodoxin [Clostridium sp.]